MNRLTRRLACAVVSVRRLSWAARALVAMVVVLSPAIASAQSADVAVSITDGPDPITAGENLTYTILVTNNGPEVALTVLMSDTLPDGTSFISLSGPAGWACTTPEVGEAGAISCATAFFEVTNTAVFALQVSVPPGLTTGTVLTNTATVSSITSDPDSGNESDTATTDVEAATLTLIHDIQGSGPTSPMVGSTVTIRCIVTADRSDGFFVQEEDADADADPATSEGIFVFTGLGPPAARFSALVQVTGTVAEFVLGNDAASSTRLESPTILQVAPPGQPLPTAVELTATFPDPAGALDQLEIVEHMRVTTAYITVSGPTEGFVSHPDEVGFDGNRFDAVVTGVARPFREAGIQSPDVPPAGTIPPIPQWDFNPERLGFARRSSGQPVIVATTGDVIGPIAGTLDYESRGYVIYPDTTLGTPVITPGTLQTMVPVPAANELTVATFQMQRFGDAIDDLGDDPLLTPEAYDRRLAKASIAIRTHLRAPDILGVQWIEKLAVLSDLANKILADGGPEYAPYLVEGNDISDHIDVGFLVKVDPVAGGQPRVSNVTVTQVGKSTTWIDPRLNMSVVLNDHPPLLLEATVNRT